jgi:hypothetical protein
MQHKFTADIELEPGRDCDARWAVRLKTFEPIILPMAEIDYVPVC